MLGLSGVVVGVLNSYNRFAVFAIAPLFWNLAIIAVLVGLSPMFSEDRIYAYAIGVLVGTALQLAMVSCRPAQHAVPDDPRLRLAQPAGQAVLLLMLPVTISLGLINVNLVINSLVGTPAAADRGAGGDRQGLPYLPCCRRGCSRSRSRR